LSFSLGLQTAERAEPQKTELAAPTAETEQIMSTVVARRAPATPAVTLTGTLEDFFYRANDGWVVGNLTLPDDETITVTGDFPDGQEGGRLKVEGTWQKHLKFGQQLKVAGWTWDDDLNHAEAMKACFGSGLFPHIGPRRAEVITGMWGGGTYAIIDPVKYTNPSGHSARRDDDDHRGELCPRAA
jgi:hypothetical protein